MKFKPGDKIPIKIGDREIMTTIDKNGTQRLPSNPVFVALFDAGVVNMNDLVRAYHYNKISFENLLEYYLNIGYSVCGFAELSNFQHLEIENPLWEK